MAEYRYRLWTMAEAIAEGDAKDAELLEHGIKYCDIERDQVVEQFGTWAATKYGVECLEAYYPIDKGRLQQEDWPLQLAEKRLGKGPVNMYDFLLAFYAARKYHYPNRYPPEYPYNCRLDRQMRVKGRPKIKPSTRFAVLTRDGYRCQLCGRDVTDGVKLEVDHKTPVSKNGVNNPDNLWTLCWDCNRGKAAKEVT